MIPGIYPGYLPGGIYPREGGDAPPGRAGIVPEGGVGFGDDHGVGQLEDCTGCTEHECDHGEAMVSLGIESGVGAGPLNAGGNGEAVRGGIDVESNFGECIGEGFNTVRFLESEVGCSLEMNFCGMGEGKSAEDGGQIGAVSHVDDDGAGAIADGESFENLFDCRVRLGVVEFGEVDLNLGVQMPEDMPEGDTTGVGRGVQSARSIEVRGRAKGESGGGLPGDMDPCVL